MTSTLRPPPAPETVADAGASLTPRHDVHSARVTGPISYLSPDGEMMKIPLGPCLIERITSTSSEIIWGAEGQSSAQLAKQDVLNAERSGHLAVFD